MLETNRLIRKLANENKKLRPLSDDDIRAVQGILLEMMSDFDRLCRKHNLRYFLCGGTALGAVRHKGFIPWDEDVDIAMPRKDYDQLADILLEEYGDRYWLQSIDRIPIYDLPFMKMRKIGTRFLEIFEPDPDHAGIFIDIYPLENIPDSAVLRFFHGSVSDFLQLCCSCVRMNLKKDRYFTYFNDPKALKIVKIKAFLGKMLSIIPLHKWCIAADRWAAKCKNEQTAYVSFPGGRKHYFGEMFRRDSLFPLQEVPFEDRSFFIPADPDGHLSALYSNYMEIPPVDQRERHTILELDLGE